MYLSATQLLHAVVALQNKFIFFLRNIVSVKFALICLFISSQDLFKGAFPILHSALECGGICTNRPRMIPAQMVITLLILGDSERTSY